MLPYQYAPLNLQKSEIRLLELLPNEETAAVECLIKTVSLDDCPVYDALSYCWGDLIFAGTINLDGHNFQVTKNLESALRHLRNPTGHRVLWVMQYA